MPVKNYADAKQDRLNRLKKIQNEGHTLKGSAIKPIELSKSEIVAIIRACGGYVNDIAKELRVSPERVRNLIKRTKEYQEACFDAREESVDIAEAQLMKKVKEGNLIAIMFKLKCHGQDRGYIDTPQKKAGDSDKRPLYIKLMPLTGDPALDSSIKKYAGRPKQLGNITMDDSSIKINESEIIEGEVI